MINKREFQPGDILMISTGEYSDYNFSGPFRVRKPLTFNYALLKELEKEWKPSYPGQKLRPYAVASLLNTLDYIEDIEATEIYVGSYGEVDETMFPK